MTTLELTHELQSEINSISDNKQLLSRILRYVRHLKAEAKADYAVPDVPHTPGDIKAGIGLFEKELEHGSMRDGMTFDMIRGHFTEKYPWLCSMK